MTAHRSPVRRWAIMAAAVIMVGILTGLAADLLILVLHVVETVLWGDGSGPFLNGLPLPPLWEIPIALTVGGAIAALAWYALRRWGRRLPSVEDAVGGSRMPLPEALADTVVQVGAVGMGASIGKELAPRELSAAIASRVAPLWGIEPAWAKILVASAAGAGLSAVYNVPLGGALFTLEILLLDFRLRTAIPAFTISAIATLLARPLIGGGPLYEVGPTNFSWSLTVLAVVLGPLLGLIALSFAAATRLASAHRPQGWHILIVMPTIFLGVGLLAMVFPAILGNGIALAEVAFAAAVPSGILLLMASAKYLATVATLRAGAVGGTLQPSVAIGATIGAAAAAGWALVWPGATSTEIAVVAAAGFLAATMQAPLSAIILTVEFTGTGLSLLVPILIAVAGSLATTAAFDRWSRRRARPMDPGRP